MEYRKLLVVAGKMLRVPIVGKDLERGLGSVPGLFSSNDLQSMFRAVSPKVALNFFIVKYLKYENFAEKRKVSAIYHGYYLFPRQTKVYKHLSKGSISMIEMFFFYSHGISCIKIIQQTFRFYSSHIIIVNLHSLISGSDAIASCRFLDAG